jgi:hypothetical protein
MSLAVALVLVVPMRWRSMAALGGLTYAGLVGGGVVTAGWHRPSDVIGAYLVAVGWGAGAAAVLILWRGVARESRVLRAPVVNSLLAGAGLGLLLVGFIGFAATLVALRQDQLDAVDLGGSYVAALVSILGANVLLVLALVTSLRGVGLDPPGAAEPTSPVDDHALFKGGRRRPIPEM